MNTLLTLVLPSFLVPLTLSLMIATLTLRLSWKGAWGLPLV